MPVAQLDRASASGAEGCGFDPRQAHHRKAPFPGDFLFLSLFSRFRPSSSFPLFRRKRGNLCCIFAATPEIAFCRALLCRKRIFEVNEPFPAPDSGHASGKSGIPPRATNHPVFNPFPRRRKPPLRKTLRAAAVREPASGGTSPPERRGYRRGGIAFRRGRAGGSALPDNLRGRTSGR